MWVIEYNYNGGDWQCPPTLYPLRHWNEDTVIVNGFSSLDGAIQAYLDCRRDYRIDNVRPEVIVRLRNEFTEEVIPTDVLCG